MARMLPKPSLAGIALVAAFGATVAAGERCELFFYKTYGAFGLPTTVKIGLETDLDLAVLRFCVNYNTKAWDATAYRRAGQVLVDPEPGEIDDKEGKVTFTFRRPDGGAVVTAGKGPIAEVVFKQGPGAYPGVHHLSATPLEAKDTGGRSLNFICAEVQPVAAPEGGSATFMVGLPSKPTSSVTATVTMGAGSDPDLSVSPTDLTFTPANWDVLKRVTVRASYDTDCFGGVGTVEVASPECVNSPVVVQVRERDCHRERLGRLLKAGESGHKTPIPPKVATVLYAVDEVTKLSDAVTQQVKRLIARQGVAEHDLLGLLRHPKRKASVWRALLVAGSPTARAMVVDAIFGPHGRSEHGRFHEVVRQGLESEELSRLLLPYLAEAASRGSIYARDRNALSLVARTPVKEAKSVIRDCILVASVQVSEEVVKDLINTRHPLTLEILETCCAAAGEGKPEVVPSLARAMALYGDAGFAAMGRSLAGKAYHPAVFEVLVSAATPAAVRAAQAVFDRRDPRVRKDALRIMLTLDEPARTRALLSALDDPSLKVKIAVLDALHNTRAPPSAEAELHVRRMGFLDVCDLETPSGGLPEEKPTPGRVRHYIVEPRERAWEVIQKWQRYERGNWGTAVGGLSMTVVRCRAWSDPQGLHVRCAALIENRTDAPVRVVRDPRLWHLVGFEGVAPRVRGAAWRRGVNTIEPDQERSSWFSIEFIVPSGAEAGREDLPLQLTYRVAAADYRSTSALLAADDILDCRAFCSRLDAENSKPFPWLRAMLQTRFRASAREAVRLNRFDRVDERRVASELNCLLRRRAFYYAEAFEGVTVPRKVRKLLRQDRQTLSDHEIQRRNRLLLEAAFPRSIARLDEPRIGWVGALKSQVVNCTVSPQRVNGTSDLAHWRRFLQQAVKTGRLSKHGAIRWERRTGGYTPARRYELTLRGDTVACDRGFWYVLPSDLKRLTPNEVRAICGFLLEHDRFATAVWLDDTRGHGTYAPSARLTLESATKRASWGALHFREGVEDAWESIITEIFGPRVQEARRRLGMPNALPKK